MGFFRKNKHNDTSTQSDLLSSQPVDSALDDSVTSVVADVAAPAENELGPWDITQKTDLDGRIDFGALRVRLVPGASISLEQPEGAPFPLAVVQSKDDSFMRVEVFAAPRSGGLWEESLPEVKDSFLESKARIETEEGPWGEQLVIFVPVLEKEDMGYCLRMFGINGQRWMLRATFGGRAALDKKAAFPFAKALADYVVSRSGLAAPAGEYLELTAPKTQELGEEAAADGTQLPDILERGPEITEVR